MAAQKTLQPKSGLDKVRETALKIIRKQIFIPIAALLILLIFNLIVNPGFFEVKLSQNAAGNPVLTGNLISFFDYGSEFAILAIGMTLVTSASGGQDISVGATIALSGATIVQTYLNLVDSMGPGGALLVGFIIACVAAMLCGLFNGILVAYLKIQPMIATLILFTAGRSIAMWICGNANINIDEPTFKLFGNFFPGIAVPAPIIIAAVCLIIIALVLRFTKLGMFSQAVGINSESSRLNGINPEKIKLIAYVILGLCVAVVALIKVSRTGTLAYAGIAKDIEMDAILAVALGGNPLGGGKFSMPASIVGAYVIQLLTTTLLNLDVSSEALPAFKAVIVIVLVILSAPIVREKLGEIGKKLKRKQSVKEAQ